MKGQIQLSKNHRKFQIIRETMFLEAANKPTTIDEICEQINIVKSYAFRKIVNELVDEGLLIIFAVGKLYHYNPNHDAIRLHLGEQVYSDVMAGIKRRIRNP